MELPGEGWVVLGTVSGAILGVVGSWLLQSSQRRVDRTDRDEREQREAVAAVLSAAFRFMAYSSEPGVHLSSPTRWLAPKRSTQAARDLNGLAVEFTQLVVYARLVNAKNCTPILDALLVALVDTSKALLDGTPPPDSLPPAINALVRWAEARWQPKAAR